jgi:hypothetical protein
MLFSEFSARSFTVFVVLSVPKYSAALLIRESENKGRLSLIIFPDTGNLNVELRCKEVLPLAGLTKPAQQSYIELLPLYKIHESVYNVKS